MKRYLIIFIMALITMTANAKPPQISVEQFFDGRYNKEKTVSTSIFKDHGTIFRTLKVTDNSAIVKKIAETLTNDITKAANYFEQTGEGGTSTFVRITNNGETIDIGFQQDPSGNSATLFIKGSEKAFK